MGEVNYTEVTLGAPSELVGGGYRMPIAVNDRDRKGNPINLDRMRTDRYMDNPVVKWKHGKGGISTPIGQTTSLRWDQRVREADFVFSDGDPDADRIRNLWNQGHIRAASIGWLDLPPGSDPRYDTELVEWSLVDIPADPDAVRSLTESVISDILERNQISTSEGSDMGDQDIQTRALSAEDMEQIRGVFEDMLNKRLGDHDKKERSALVDDLAAAASNRMTSVLEARDAAEANARKAEEAKTQAEADVQARAMARADLIVQVRSVGLIPDDEDVSAMTDREIRIRAIGDELQNAEDRSDDYIAAVLDGVVNRRNVADGQRQQMANRGTPVVNAADLDADGLRTAIAAQSISPAEAITRSQEFYRQEQARMYREAGGR